MIRNKYLGAEDVQTLTLQWVVFITGLDDNPIIDSRRSSWSMVNGFPYSSFRIVDQQWIRSELSLNESGAQDESEYMAKIATEALLMTGNSVIIESYLGDETYTLNFIIKCRTNGYKIGIINVNGENENSFEDEFAGKNSIFRVISKHADFVTQVAHDKSEISLTSRRYFDQVPQQEQQHPIERALADIVQFGKVN